MNKRRISLNIGVFLIIFTLIFSYSAFAEGDADLGDEKASVVETIVEHLNLYSRYDDITQAKLYKEGLLNVIKENPELYESVLKHMLESVDEYSEYYPPEDIDELNELMFGEFTGIGITYQMCPDGVDVISVIDGAPAQAAGITVGDIIVSADGVSLVGMNTNEVMKYIRGEAGTTVRLEIKKGGVGNTIFYDIVREKIVETSVGSEIVENNGKKLMYIRISGFLANTADSLKKELETAKENNIENLIIDLRDNGGGYFDQAIAMADCFLPEGSIITLESHKADIFNTTYYATQKVVPKFNVVILINENSASSSEVFTAAMRENDKAYLIGTRSFGKGTVQSVAQLPFGDSMKYTIAYYLTPKGNNIHKIGIEPDLTVENVINDIDMSQYPPFTYTRKYEIGDKDDEIKTAKELLKLWGTYDGEINDIYDKEAESAVYKFQTQTGLYAYGVFDYSTQQQLYARIEKSKTIEDKQLDAAFEHFAMKPYEK